MCRLYEIVCVSFKMHLIKDTSYFSSYKWPYYNTARLKGFKTSLKQICTLANLLLGLTKPSLSKQTCSSLRLAKSWVLSSKQTSGCRCCWCTK